MTLHNFRNQKKQNYWQVYPPLEQMMTHFPQVQLSSRWNHSIRYYDHQIHEIILLEVTVPFNYLEDLASARYHKESKENYQLLSGNSKCNLDYKLQIILPLKLGQLVIDLCPLVQTCSSHSLLSQGHM